MRPGWKEPELVPLNIVSIQGNSQPCPEAVFYGVVPPSLLQEREAAFLEGIPGAGIFKYSGI